MSVSVSKTLLFPTLTNVKFSDLRTSFKETPAGAISASELRRDTRTTETNPIVPDATENAAVSTANDLKISQFQNTIKYYDLNQSGTDLNLNLAVQTWNSNLFKNIKKRININGTCGSNSTGSAALSLSGIMFNVFLIINGSVLGAGGAGGGPAAAGANGGPAMSLSSSGNAITVITTASGAVYGGGGGGAGGKTGDAGPVGTCYYVSDYNTGTSCGGCPGCAAGYYSIGCNSAGGCNCGKGGCRSTNYYTTCRTNVYYNSAAPAGGTGGSGGPGRGYNYQAPNSLAGSAGSAGALSDCSPNYTQTQTQGATGETGGSGGDWGTGGSSTTAAGGGATGAAVIGGYVLSADAVTSAFKGPR